MVDDEARQRYLRSIESSADYPEVILGSNTSRILSSDPKLLLFTLARYKFVSKIFEGFDSVAEVGCQEGFGIPIVSNVVKRIHGVDFFEPHIESCKRRINFLDNATFHVGDITCGPINGGPFQGVFSLDVMEHVDKSNDDLFLRNCCESLLPHGVLVVGMPSIESQVYASRESKLGHVNCKSKSELATVCRKFFHNVFSFSMNDEVVHTGFGPMSHYIFCVCVNPR